MIECLHSFFQPNGPLHKVETQIIHLCVPSRHDLLAWMTGIRLAKVNQNVVKYRGFP